MSPENPVTTNVKEASGAPPMPASEHVQNSSGADYISPQNVRPLDASYNATSEDTGSSIVTPFLGVPMFPSLPGTRPKRTQCKNACTNCQKACKRCDDYRPCQRCIRYDTINTCVDSKRKERKKGIKRGPYKKCDNKGYPSPGGKDVESGVTNSISGHYHSMPYIGLVHYPPSMWNPYTQTGPVTTQAPLHTNNATEGQDVVVAPHFPIGFYPATFIPYPGSYPHYPILPPGSGSPPHGFHYAYPPFPGAFLPRLPYTIGNSSGNPPPDINSQRSVTTQNMDDNSGKADSTEKGKLRDAVMDQQDVEDNSDSDNEKILEDVVE